VALISISIVCRGQSTQALNNVVTINHSQSRITTDADDDDDDDFQQQQLQQLATCTAASRSDVIDSMQQPAMSVPCVH